MISIRLFRRGLILDCVGCFAQCPSRSCRCPGCDRRCLGGHFRAPGRTATAESEIDGKALVFSQFLAVPSALAGLISYSVEAKWASRRKLGKSEPYLAAAGQSRLDARDDRPNLLELFHPSPVLASLEPLAGGSRSVLGAKAALQAQLRAKLKQAKIVVSQSGARDRALLKPWELLVLVESRLGEWDASAKAWGTLADEAVRANKKATNAGESSSAVRTLLDKWQKASHLDTIEIDDDQEFNRLVDVAIESPAVVLARSLRRHWPDALSADHRTLLTGVAWRGLRTYLDTPWFVSLLEGGRGSSYAAAVRQAVIDGNLESVLDEHFWYVSTKAATWPERLAEFETALRIRNTRIMLHEIADRDAWFSLRCHVAAALTETRNRSQGPTNPGEEDAVADRPEDVRKAFNSPFWPHVLVTTSVGQEGLDFHPWCRSLVHWDLCGGPIDLEQREGRINRYAGLSIRRAVAAELAVSVRPNGKGGSPWSELATIADEQLSDRTGLSPWWVAPGAKTKRFFFDIPGSDVKFRAAALAWERAHYRLVLGMPDQADLLERVAAHGELDQRSMRDACLDLAAINLPDE